MCLNYVHLTERAACSWGYYTVRNINTLGSQSDLIIYYLIQIVSSADRVMVRGILTIKQGKHLNL